MKEFKLPPPYRLSDDVRQALEMKTALLALESAVITHGLPRPVNLQLAVELENISRNAGAVPATIALLHGHIHVGLSRPELVELANADQVHKISRRNLGIAAVCGWSGGTTVAATMIAAQAAGIIVFATGGIGGVHRGQTFDISADLDELSRTPIIVVCAGAKSILDLPATLEVLETRGVPIIGFQTDEFPAFFSSTSGLPVDVSARTLDELADIALSHRALGLTSALLVVVPPPPEKAIPPAEVETWIHRAVEEAEKTGITGAAVTPFLLERVNQLSAGRSMDVNLALLRNNASIGAALAARLSSKDRKYF